MAVFLSFAVTLGCNTGVQPLATSTVSSIKLVRLDATELELATSPIPLRSNVKFTFSEAVSFETNRAAFENGTSLVNPAGMSVSGVFGWAADYTSVIYTISYNLKYDTVYTITIPEAFVPSASLSAKMISAANTFNTAVKNDINGDGYADLLINAQDYPNDAEQGRAYIFLGSVSPLASILAANADTIITGVQNLDGEDGDVRILGDINGDGYADIAVGMPGFSGSGLTLPFTGTGRINIFYGSASGIATCDLSICTPSVMINSVNAIDILGYVMSEAGDINGDGYYDFIFYSYTSASSSNIRILLGSGSLASSLTINDANFLISDSGVVSAASFGISGLTGVGDVDGDHRDDIIIGEVSFSTNKGRGYLFYGSSLTRNLTSADADATFTGETANDRFSSGMSGGDINGDGYSDIILGASDYPSGAKYGRAYVFLGGSSLFSGDIAANAADTIVTGPADLPVSSIGLQTSGGQDVNNDGYDDLVVSGASPLVVRSGKMHLFLGSASGITNCDLSSCAATATVVDATPGDNPSVFGLSIYDAGDVNGDENDDIVTGAAGYAFVEGQYVGAAAVFYGLDLTGSLNFPGDADIIIRGENASDKFGYPVR